MMTEKKINKPYSCIIDTFVFLDTRTYNNCFRPVCVLQSIGSVFFASMDESWPKIKC